MTYFIRTKVSERAKAYLRACADWKADYEVVQALGDTPPMNPRRARIHLGRMIGWGLIEWHQGNNTYRTTDEGKALLSPGESVDKENGK